MKKILVNLNRVYCEINEFNNEFWQKILLICLTFHSTIIFVLAHMIYSGQFKKYIFSFALYHYLIFHMVAISLYINSSYFIESQSSKTLSLLFQHIHKCKNLNSKIKFKVIFLSLLSVIWFCSFSDVNIHRKTNIQKKWFHIWKSNNWSRDFVYSKKKKLFGKKLINNFYFQDHQDCCFVFCFDSKTSYSLSPVLICISISYS